MSEIKLRLLLPGCQSASIFVDDHDSIADWIPDILKNHSFTESADQFTIFRNDVAIPTIHQRFSEAGFRQGDTLLVKEISGEAAPQQPSPAPPVADDISGGEVIPSDQPMAAPPQPATGKQQVMSRPSKQVRLYVILPVIALLAAGFCVYLWWGRDYAEPGPVVVETSPAVPQPGAEVANAVSVQKAPALIPVPAPPDNATASGIQQERPEAPQPVAEEVITVDDLSVSQCLRKLAAPGISERKAAALKAQLLRQFQSPETPVIKMHDGYPTNTGISIGDYIESVVLLNTKVTIVRTESIDSKISRIFITEE